MEMDNIRVRHFYKRGSAGEISDMDIKRALGLNGIPNVRFENKKNSQLLQKELERNVNSIKGNMKIFGNVYTKYNIKSGKTDYSSFVKGTISVKHAFKMLYPSNLAKSIWDIQDDSNPILFQEIKDIKIKGNKDAVPVITIGSLMKDHENDPVRLLEKMIKDMKVLSKEVRSIADIQLGLMSDQFYSISLLIKSAKIKLPKNDICYCGSNMKYKKCHMLIT
jgi:hypothetical protein